MHAAALMQWSHHDFVLAKTIANPIHRACARASTCTGSIDKLSQA